MRIRFGPGPVFVAECLTASRHVQFYAMRVLLVAGLLAGLCVIWFSEGISWRELSIQELSGIGRSFYRAMMAVELTMALLIAPAAAAGAICQDRARGGLALMMTTDLSDAEIVLGRLASRLLSTFGVLACGFPVLTLAILLGGVDPMEVVGGTLVVVGVAMVSVTLAMTFSLWAGKAHEALSATYAFWGVWNLTYIAWDALFRHPPELIQWSNPFWLLFARGWFMPPFQPLFLKISFFVGALVISSVLAGFSTWRLRSVILPKPGKKREPKLRRRLSPTWLRWIGQGAPALDRDPILWREWHRKRPTAFSKWIWGTFFTLSILFAFLSLFVRDIAAGVVGFQVSIGLLFACVGAATSLAEERAQGGLDVVMATPISSRCIVLGKWWGAYRIVPRLAIVPVVIGFFQSFIAQHPQTGLLMTPSGLVMTCLILCAVLSYGAVVTSFGLVMAILQPQQGRASALTVAAYLTLTVAWPAIILTNFNGPESWLALSISPFFAVFLPMAEIIWLGIPGGNLSPTLGFAIVAGVATLALGLLGTALLLFNRCLGRVAEAPRKSATKPHKPDLIKEDCIVS